MANFSKDFEEFFLFRLVKVLYILALVFSFIVIFFVGVRVFNEDKSLAWMLGCWIIGSFLVYMFLKTIKETLLYVFLGKKISWSWSNVKNTISESNHLQENEKNYQPYLIDPSLAASLIASIFVDKEKPFVGWNPPELFIPAEMENTIFCATSGYAFYIYLLLIRKKFGKEVSLVVKNHLVIILNRINWGNTIQYLLNFIEEGVENSKNSDMLLSNGDKVPEEYHIALNILLNMKGNPCYVPEEERKNLTPEDSELLLEKYVKNRDKLVAVCLIHSKSVALEVFFPIIDSFQFDPNSVKGLDQSLEILWSENPGCFEKQLQRKFNNPIFPRDKRVISQSEVDDARKKDIEDENNFRIKIDKLFSSLEPNLPFPYPIDYLNRVREEIDDLIDQAYTIGGNALKNIVTLTELREKIIETWNIYLENNPEALLQLQKAEIHHNGLVVGKNPFLMQVMRPDSPVIPELEYSILCENLDTIKLFYEYISDSDLIDQLKLKVIAAVKSMFSRGENMSNLKEKLEALAISEDLMEGIR